MLPALIAAVSVAATPSAAATPPTPSAAEAHNFATQLAQAGPRPAASAAERRAHQRVAARFRQAGLRVGTERFTVPGKGTSRDVIGIRDVPARCLVIVMAHADSVPPAPGADDNASGVGTIVALAPALAKGPAPKCDTWLVATGSEERPYTKQPDHLGASALVRRLRRTHRLDDVHLALSLDEVVAAGVPLCGRPLRSAGRLWRLDCRVRLRVGRQLAARPTSPRSSPPTTTWPWACFGPSTRPGGVPEDVSVVGFDDVPEAEFQMVPLTTVAVDADDRGRRILSELVRMIEGARPGRPMTIDGRPRDPRSTGPPPDTRSDRRTSLPQLYLPMLRP